MGGASKHIAVIEAIITSSFTSLLLPVLLAAVLILGGVLILDFLAGVFGSAILYRSNRTVETELSAPWPSTNDWSFENATDPEQQERTLLDPLIQFKLATGVVQHVIGVSCASLVLFAMAGFCMFGSLLIAEGCKYTGRSRKPGDDTITTRQPFVDSTSRQHACSQTRGQHERAGAGSARPPMRSEERSQLVVRGCCCRWWHTSSPVRCLESIAPVFCSTRRAVLLLLVTALSAIAAIEALFQYIPEKGLDAGEGEGEGEGEGGSSGGFLGPGPMVMSFTSARGLVWASWYYASRAMLGRRWTIGDVRRSVPELSTSSPGFSLSGAIFVSTVVISTLIIGSANAAHPVAEVRAKRGRMRIIVQCVLCAFATNAIISATTGFTNLGASTLTHEDGVSAVRDLARLREQAEAENGSLSGRDAPLLEGADGQPVYFLALHRHAMLAEGEHDSGNATASLRRAVTTGAVRPRVADALDNSIARTATVDTCLVRMSSAEASIALSARVWVISEMETRAVAAGANGSIPGSNSSPLFPVRAGDILRASGALQPSVYEVPLSGATAFLPWFLIVTSFVYVVSLVWGFGLFLLTPTVGLRAAVRRADRIFARWVVVARIRGSQKAESFDRPPQGRVHSAKVAPGPESDFSGSALLDRNHAVDSGSGGGGSQAPTAGSGGNGSYRNHRHTHAEIKAQW